MARKNLYINNTNIGTYGIYISSDTYLDAPKIDYAEFQIPARTGTAILDNKRLNNVIRKFDCYIPEVENVENGLGQLKRLLYSNKGYLKLSSDYETGYYQYGYLAQELNVKPFNDKAAEFSLYFSCMPQKYENVNALHTTTYNTTNAYMNRYVRNGSRAIVTLLANAKLDYPYSPIGWLHDLSALAVGQGTHTVSCTSTNAQKYMIALERSPIGQINTYELIGEVDSYNGSFSFNVPVDYDATYYVHVFTPLLDYDPTISFTVGADSGQLNFEYNTITSTDFVNLAAMGCSPVFIYKKRVNQMSPDTQNIAGVDLFEINGNMYLVDYSRMADDYTVQTLFNSYAHYVQADDKYYFYIKIDFANGKLYFLDTFAIDGNVSFDASNYFLKYETGSFKGSNTITAKFASEHLNLTRGDLEDIKFQAGWWKL